MPKPLSVDLRTRVVEAIRGGMSRRQAAAQFRIGASSAIRWMANAEATGRVEPKRTGGDQRSGLIESQSALLLSLRERQPDTTLREYQAALAQVGVSVSVTAIWRFFERRKITLKKSPRTPPSRTVRTS